jgi:hypothetical protein
LVTKGFERLLVLGEIFPINFNYIENYSQGNHETLEISTTLHFVPADFHILDPAFLLSSIRNITKISGGSRVRKYL